MKLIIKIKVPQPFEVETYEFEGETLIVNSEAGLTQVQVDSLPKLLFQTNDLVSIKWD